MKIKMIFFDMGGTIDLYPVSKKGILDTCNEMKQMLENAGAYQFKKFSEKEFFDIIINGLKVYKKWTLKDENEVLPEKLFSDFILKDYGVDVNITNALGEELAYLIDTGFYKRSPRPEADEVLKAIKGRGIKMGIISNVMSRSQVERHLKQYGLFEYFDIIILSAVVGKRKPDPEIFHHAFKAAGVDPENVIFVGNSPGKDIAGGKKAGVGKTVLIESNETPEDEAGPEADYTIQNLKELLPIIDQLNK